MFQFAKEILYSLHSHIILLSGTLGAGKTTFVKGIARAMGISTPIVSPSFQIICEYTEKNMTLVHIDLYRVKNCNEVELLDIPYLCAQSMQHIICVEWPERCLYLFDHYNPLKITLTVEKESQTRKLQITCP